jgi:hypothetical protein
LLIIFEFSDAGVKVLWHIFPESKKIHVYKDSKQILIFSGSDLCSAEAAIEDFVLSVDAVFENV